MPKEVESFALIDGLKIAGFAEYTLRPIGSVGRPKLLFTIGTSAGPQFIRIQHLFATFHPHIWMNAGKWNAMCAVEGELLRDDLVLASGLQTGECFCTDLVLHIIDRIGQLLCMIDFVRMESRRFAPGKPAAQDFFFCEGLIEHRERFVIRK